MKNGIFLYSLATAVVSFISIAYAEIEPPADLKLGTGYDAFLGEPRGNCVVSSGQSSDGGLYSAFPSRLFESVNIAAGSSSQVGEMRFYLSDVVSASQLESALKIDTKAKLEIGAFGGRISYTNVRSLTQESQSRYLIASVHFQTDIVAPSFELTSEASDLLSQGGADAFRLRCGTHFVGSAVGEASFIAVVKIRNASSLQSNAVRAALRASYFGADAEATYDEKSKQVVRESNLEIRIHTRGPIGAVEPIGSDGLTKVESLIAGFQDFVSAIQTTGQDSMHSAAASMRGYVSLDHRAYVSNRRLVLLESFALAMDRALRWNEAMTDALNGRLSHLPPLNRDEAERALDRINERKLQIRAAALACAEAPIGDPGMDTLCTVPAWTAEPEFFSSPIRWTNLIVSQQNDLGTVLSNRKACLFVDGMVRPDGDQVQADGLPRQQPAAVAFRFRGLPNQPTSGDDDIFGSHVMVGLLVPGNTRVLAEYEGYEDQLPGVPAPRYAMVHCRDGNGPLGCQAKADQPNSLESFCLSP